MIIACPACSTRYVVPDSAIGAEGRTVRCAKCRHSWHVDGPVLDLAEMAPPPPAPAPAAPAQQPEPRPAAVQRPAPPPAAPPAFDERPDDALSGPPADVSPRRLSEEPLDEPEARPDPRPVAATYSDDDLPPPTVVERERAAEPEPEGYGEEVSQFDYAPPFRPRRNMMKVWTIAAALFAAIALGTVAAVSYWGLPDWVPISRPTFALGQRDLVLDFPRDQLDRRTLPDGTEFFGVSGTVKNVGRETLRLPPVLIVMSDARDRKVFSWEIAPPKATIAAGETVTINQAVTDVPKSARFVDIGWKPT
ncbi:zinc-ribbon domain-containing protein [Tsuneonella amylolytica]|uniref:zinc-ribbon domain-containing protein n=1 Tax=Tsuneonella amylolytica TaxID=2338327 RepID=UPI000EA8C7AC|nr:zinc-ribbon domain-containing protein [Tsuneonella amylolytica]